MLLQRVHKLGLLIILSFRQGDTGNRKAHILMIGYQASSVRHAAALLMPQRSQIALVNACSPQQLEVPLVKEIAAEFAFVQNRPLDCDFEFSRQVWQFFIMRIIETYIFAVMLLRTLQ